MSGALLVDWADGENAGSGEVPLPESSLPARLQKMVVNEDAEMCPGGERTVGCTLI